MSVGTTVKVGFDSTRVDQGMRGLSGKFSRFARQVGIGMARDVGTRSMDLLGRMLSFIPEGMKEVADWAGGLQDLSTQTNETVESLVLLEEKMRLSGAGQDSGRVLSTMARSLFEARTEAGSAREAINKLGFLAPDFDGKTLSESFEMIGRSAQMFGGEIGELETIMSDIFGAKMGNKLLMFFRDFEGNSKQAENNVGDFAKRMNDQAAGLDRFGDSLGRVGILKKQVMSMLASDVLFRFSGGAGTMDSLFDALDPERLRPAIAKLGNFIGRNLEVIMTDGFSFSDLFKNIGRSIGEGMKEALMDLIPKMPSFSPIAGIKGLFSSTSTDGMGEADKQAPKQTELLTDIRREIGVARFA